MIRGTTPTHIFTLPFDASVVQSMRVIYSQDGTPVITKTLENCTIEAEAVSVKLSQEDTLAFDYTKLVEIQIRVLTPAGDALASDIICVSVARCLENEVLV